MNETILQSFLNNQFIRTTEGDNIESLKKAVVALKKVLTAKKQLVIPYTLVALDPQINDTDPIVVEVEKLIIKNWSTFKNSTSTEDKATTYVRTVILQTLAELSTDESIAAIVWLTGRNVLSYYNLQKEQVFVSKLLIEMGSQFEVKSREYWSIQEVKPVSLPEITISEPSSSSSTIEEEDLLNVLSTAAIHTGWSSQSGLPGNNPSYASQGNWEWEKFFVENASEGLADLINTTLKEQDGNLTKIAGSIQKDINAYFKQFTTFFLESSKVIKLSTEASAKRSDLLWWKQSLYSPILRGSYRDQPPMKTVMAMVSDLSELIGTIYPESVNYLLRETLRDIFGSEVDNAHSFNKWFSDAKENSDIGKLALEKLHDDSGNRKSLSSALYNNLINDGEADFLEETGIDADKEVSLSELAVWMLHDLQAKKISVENKK